MSLYADAELFAIIFPFFMAILFVDFAFVIIPAVVVTVYPFKSSSTSSDEEQYISFSLTVMFDVSFPLPPFLNRLTYSSAVEIDVI